MKSDWFFTNTGRLATLNQLTELYQLIHEDSAPTYEDIMKEFKVVPLTTSQAFSIAKNRKELIKATRIWHELSDWGIKESRDYVQDIIERSK